jgi:3',5'-cyclic AMP phosphodiesterase CpdA
MIVAFSFIPIGVAGLMEWLFRQTPEQQPASHETAISNAAAPPEPKPLSTEPLVSFFLLSDLHVTAEDSTMNEKLHWALQDVSDFESPVDTIVLGGDLTDLGRDSDYVFLKKAFKQYQLPELHANMGNHDYYDIWLTRTGEFSSETMPNGKTDQMSKDRFMNFFGYNKPYHDAWINGVHFIMLSQDAYVQEKSDVGEGAWYSDEQLDWLEEQMKQHADGKPAIVFIHQPLPEPGQDGATHRLIRAIKFRQILKPYRNVFVLSGHTHMNFVGTSHYNTQNTFHWFNNASVGRTRGGVPGKGHANPSQGMYVQVFDDRVIVRGREFADRSWIEDASYTVPFI